MTRLLQNTNIKKRLLTWLTCFAAVLIIASCKKDHEVPQLKITTVASGFVGTSGVETDKYGNVWVSETGNGNNNGKVSVITRNGTRYDAIVNLESVINDGGEVEGPSHLLFHDGLLYIIGAKSKLYKANVSAFKPGNTPINASSLAVEDIGTFVLAYPFVNNTHYSHLYNLTAGPDGALYMTDAGANAIIRRARSGVLSVLAEVPGIPNPTPVGPPQIESVPTGIIYDGHNFLVTTLLGFPFPQGQSIIYKISKSGGVSIYQQGFTSLVDIEEGGYSGHLVLEHGVFGQMGFAPNTGRLVWANGNTATKLADGLNLPVGLKQANYTTWYVTTLDGNLLKITYQ